MDLREDADQPEGIGKTQAALTLGGMAWQSGSPPVITELDSLEEVPLINTRETGFRTFASDMVYWSTRAKELSATRPIGEPLIALWDLARHVLRRTDPEYYSGKQRQAEGRRLLDTILKRIPYRLLRQIYLGGSDRIVLEEFFVLRNAYGELSPGEAVVHPAGESDGLRLLQQAMCNCLHHRSDFWKRSSRRHLQAVGEIFGELQTPLRVTVVDCGYGSAETFAGLIGDSI